MIVYDYQIRWRSVMIFLNTEQMKELREIGFPTEKAMQTFCEKHLYELLGLRFIATEFVVAQFRFDSIAYDETTKSFVIIEYKNDQNFSVIDQGYSYISTALSHKADFVLKYNQVFTASKGRQGQSRPEDHLAHQRPRQHNHDTEYLRACP